MKTPFAILCIVTITLAANWALDDFLKPEQQGSIPQEQMRGAPQPMCCPQPYERREREQIVKRLAHVMEHPDKDRGERFALEWVLQYRDTMDDATE